MSYRNRTGLCGLLIGCTLAIASACGGLDDVKVIIKDDAGGNPSGGNGASGKGGALAGGGDTSSAGATGVAGAAGAADAAGAAGVSAVAGAAGEDASGGEGGQINIIPPDPMPGPPTVLTVSPRDQSTAADPTDTIRISFSEPLDPASVTDASVQIKDAAGTLIGGSLSYADAVVTFRPKGRMNLLGSYSVSVSTALTDAGKMPMERAFASSFSVRDGVWGKVESSLSNSTLTFDRGSPVALATDGAGRVVAVWAQTSDNTNYDIYSALFFEGKGWASPVKVSIDALNCQSPAVSMNASGDFIVAWIERDPTLNTNSVYARRNIANNWDATTTRVDLPPTVIFTINPGDITVAMAANGHAFVAWDSYYNDSSAVPSLDYYSVYARHVDTSGRWDASLTAFTNSLVGTAVGAPALAFDAASNGFIAYQFSSGSPTKANLLVFHYVASTAKWGASTVSSTPSDASLPVAVATNPAGQAVLSWGRYTAAVAPATTPTYELMGAYFDRAWSTPVVISSSTTTIASIPTMASATWTGTSFLVAWAQSGGSLSNIYASQYKTAWASAAIVSDGNHSSGPPWLSGDGRGNALAVWAQQSDTVSTQFSSTDIAFSRFSGASDKWADSKRVSGALAGFRYPEVVTLGDGSAVAAWQSVNGVVIKTQKMIDALKNEFQ